MLLCFICYLYVNRYVRDMISQENILLVCRFFNNINRCNYHQEVPWLAACQLWATVVSVSAINTTHSFKVYCHMRGICNVETVILTVNSNTISIKRHLFVTNIPLHFVSLGLQNSDTFLNIVSSTSRGRYRTAINGYATVSPETRIRRLLSNCTVNKYTW